MAGRDVFISYSREDRAAARHFAQSLSDEGLSVWWDAALHSGETFDEVIERELRAAKAVIVLWSPRSVSSRWVRAEATLADRQHKLVPVAIESCDRPIIFELTHTNDLADWTGDVMDARWKALVGDLRRLVGHGPSESSAIIPNPAESAPRKPQYRSPAVDDSQATQFYTGANAIDMFHCLEIDGGHDSTKRFVVSPTGLRIGRAPPADIVLTDKQVSRSHCLVELADGGLRVSDLNSTNGTFIDGERISGPSQLGVGSLLRVGTVLMKHQVRTSRTLQESQVGA